MALDRTYLFARHARSIEGSQLSAGTDAPLSEIGEAQARQLGRTFARAGCDVGSVERRIRGALARLDAMGERRIAIVSHGYLIFLVSVVVPGGVWARPMRNCSITRVLADGRGTYRLAAFAEDVLGAQR